MFKIEVNHCGGKDSFLFSLEKNRIFSYELDSKRVFHEDSNKYSSVLEDNGYKVNNYYTSLSGLSGNGNVYGNDLIKFGYYRIDCNSHLEQHREVVAKDDRDQDIFGYIPLVSHKGTEGVDRGYPIILTNGHKIALISKYELLESLINFNSLFDKSYEQNFEFIGYYQNKTNKKYQVYCSDNNYLKLDGFRGNLMSRFLDLRYYKDQWDNALSNKKIGIECVQDYIKEFLAMKLNLIYLPSESFVEDKSMFLYFGKLIVPTTSLKLEEIQTNGWQGWEYKEPIYFRREKDYINAFSVRERNKKYMLKDDNFIEFNYPFVEWEEHISVIRWYTEPSSRSTKNDCNINKYWSDYFSRKMLEKERKEFVHYKKMTIMHGLDKKDYKEKLKEHTELMIGKKLSVDSGNCPFGTDDFIKKYSLKEEGNTSLGILEHKKFDEMLSNQYFKKVIDFAIIKEAK